jgi:hypothetical protein
MLIDIMHMSQRSVDNTLRIAEGAHYPLVTIARVVSRSQLPQNEHG